MLVTMNEVVLQQLAADIEARVMQAAESLVSVLRLMQVEALKGIESEARKAGIAVREEIQKDIDRGHLHARELIVEINRTYSRSAMRRWVAFGVVVAGGLLVLGIGLGFALTRILK